MDQGHKWSPARRWGIRAALLALVMAALALWLFRPVRVAEQTPPPEPTRPRTAWPAPAVEPVAAAVTTKAKASAPSPPVIDEISIEKTELCAGEENLVTVKAHSGDGNTELRYVIAGQAGNPVPLRVYRADDGPTPSRRVSVFAAGAAVHAEVPAFHVKDCGEQSIALVSHRALPNRLDEIEFDVRVLHAPRAFVAHRYEWSFGDGSFATTREPVVSHSYASRLQRSVYSRYLAEVRVVDDSGRSIRGRHSLELLNRAEQVLRERGIVLIQAELTPRFPEMDAHGTLRQRVRLFHQADASVVLDSVGLERGRKGNQRVLPEGLEKVEPNAALGISAIPTGKGVEIELVLPRDREPDVMTFTYVLSGRVGDHVARGSFSLMRPPVAPTREHHRPVTSAALKAKIVAAQRILGKPLVSAEELGSLERRGAFENLCSGGSCESEPHVARF
ncbi:MAG: hypothetical protein ACOY0T_22300 [Myxococcota bacterium]